MADVWNLLLLYGWCTEARGQRPCQLYIVAINPNVGSQRLGTPLLVLPIIQFLLQS